MKRAIHSLLQRTKNLPYSLKKTPARFLHKNIPYFSQWESPDLNKQIVTRTFDVKKDPNWRGSGANTKQEYEAWSWSGCGMACTKMLLAGSTGKVLPLVTLGKKCANYGGYTFPLETSGGLIYRPYLEFIRKEMGWKGKIISHASVHQLFHELSKGRFIIASVSPTIRTPDQSAPKVKGGHLILLLGYDKTKDIIYFHNPSGTSKQTQNYATVSLGQFKKFFSGRGIVITA